MFVSICTVDVYHCLPVDVCFHHVYFKKKAGADRHRHSLRTGGSSDGGAVATETQSDEATNTCSSPAACSLFKSSIDLPIAMQHAEDVGINFTNLVFGQGSEQQSL